MCKLRFSKFVPTFATFGTFLVFLAQVSFNMNLEIIGAAECLLAVRAFEIAIAMIAMHLQMTSQQVLRFVLFFAPRLGTSIELA